MKVGLAVDDIKGILDSAELTRIESKVCIYNICALHIIIYFTIVTLD